MLNETDLSISRSQLEMYLDMYDEVPYSVLQLLTQFINYGGRVTDDKDLRTIDIIMRTFYCKEILNDDYSFSESGTYTSFAYDESAAHESYMEYIKGLPINPAPEVFGFHANASITSAQDAIYAMFSTIVSLQPRSSGGEVERAGSTSFTTRHTGLRVCFLPSWTRRLL